MEHHERRQSRRATVHDGVTVEIVGRGRALRLVNVGEGGFAVASDDNLAAISRPTFRFARNGDDWSTVLTAQLAYCLLRPRQEGPHRGKYVTGYTFCDSAQPDVRDRIRDFLNHVAPSLLQG
jgi:hypothetical protein